MLPRSEDEQKIGRALIFFDQAMKWLMRKMMLSFKPVFAVENQWMLRVRVVYRYGANSLVVNKQKHVDVNIEITIDVIEIPLLVVHT